MSPEAGGGAPHPSILTSYHPGDPLDVQLAYAKADAAQADDITDRMRRKLTRMQERAHGLVASATESLASAQAEAAAAHARVAQLTRAANSTPDGNTAGNHTIPDQDGGS